MIYNKGENRNRKGRRVKVNTLKMPETITALRKNKCNKNVMFYKNQK